MRGVIIIWSICNFFLIALSTWILQFWFSGYSFIHKDNKNEILLNSFSYKKYKAQQLLLCEKQFGQRSYLEQFFTSEYFCYGEIQTESRQSKLEFNISNSEYSTKSQLTATQTHACSHPICLNSYWMIEPLMMILDIIVSHLVNSDFLFSKMTHAMLMTKSSYGQKNASSLCH